MNETQEHWDAMYGEREQLWSGKANEALVDVVEPMPAGHAIDVGCGEGADAIWLARQGWTVTGIDVSSTAVRRARAAADAASDTGGIGPDQIRWLEQDLASWHPDEQADLVSACFLHSTLEFDRLTILQRAAGAIRPGGHLLIVSHASSPPWSQHSHDHEDLPSASKEAEALDLDSNHWQLLICEHRWRAAIGPDGGQANLEDVVVLAERRSR